MEDDIIAAINRFLGEDERDPEGDLRADAPPARPPRVGTIIQRSDHINRRKIEALATPPPPLSAVKRRVPAERMRPKSKPAMEAEKPEEPARAPPMVPQVSMPPTPHAPTEETERAPEQPTTRDPRPVRPTPGQIVRYTGPVASPPIWVELEPGYSYPVPHFTVHVARRYRPRTPRGRWSLRFDREGRLRYRRKIE